MSPDYFLPGHPPEHSWRRRHPVVRVAVRAVKTAAGMFLLLAGIAMLVLPGQGILTILVSIGLLEFPGKRRLERSLVRRPPVHRALNWVRRRFGRPPIQVPP